MLPRSSRPGAGAVEQRTGASERSRTRWAAAEPRGSSLAQAVERGYLVTLGRPADADEMDASLAFIARATELYEAAGKTDAAKMAVADFCQVLFDLNEFIYVD